MTEIEKIKRAKMYIDHLANGINPLDNSIISEQDIVNNVRISRCLFFVSSVLENVIKHDYSQQISKTKKESFHLNEIEKDQFEFSEKPIPISEITNRINLIIKDKNMAKFKHSYIISWLVYKQLLEEFYSEDNRTKRQPTNKGYNIGISMENRISCNGNIYNVILYNKNAQHYIIDNIDNICEFANSICQFQGTLWTKEQEECLIDLYKQNVSIREIAITLKRNESAIKRRAKDLGLIR